MKNTSSNGKDGGLTGRRRYRATEEGLVLQVEECIWNDAAEGKPGRWINVWRDAYAGDLSESDLCG